MLCDASDEVRGMTTRLPSLSHVPVEDVLGAIEELAILLCHNTRAWTSCLLTRLRHTYVCGRRLPGRGH